jgi:hypothetical protein
MHKNYNSTLHYFSVIALCYFSNFLSRTLLKQPLRYQHETSWVDRSLSGGGVQCTRLITLPFIIFELLPFVIFHT